MTSPMFLPEAPQVRGRDPNFTEAINQRMRVPERLRVGPGALDGADSLGPEDPPPVYSMHIPDRLALTDAPDLSPRPLFSKHAPLGPGASLWDHPKGPWDREPHAREPGQTSLRRSFSDQAFGRTPPGTPTHSKQALHSPSHRSLGRNIAADPLHATPLATPQGPPPAIPPGLLTPQSMLQAAKELGRQASQKLLETVSHKYSSSRFGLPERPTPQAVEAHADPNTRKSALQESWLGPEEDSGTAVELIVLRRQVVKMSRRLACMERQNAERRQTEVLLFSMLASACLLNAWLWIRR